MTNHPRSALAASPLALALTLTLSVGASAQVASLVSPDETPEPEAVEAMLEFADREEAMLAYADCMRDNGIDMDDPVAGEGGGRGFLRPGGPGDGQSDQFDEDFQVAREACSPILEAARPEIDPEAEQERLEQQLLLAECIRQSGYPEYPDPAIGDDGRLQRVRGQGAGDLGIDPRSEEFREVVATCRDEIGLEAFGPGGGPGFGRGGQ